MSFYRNKWFKFAVWGGLYLLWVIWLGNYWWLLGLPIIFDIYVTKKVHWAFWKRKQKSSEGQTATNSGETIPEHTATNVVLDWVDAIIFAVVAAMIIKIFWFEAYTIPSSSMEKTLFTGDYLFVSKVAYGPKVPETPLSVPLVHNVMPISGKESYSTLIQNKYRRLKGFGHVKRDDIVVFAFPDGDTVLKKDPQADYYQIVRLNNNDRDFVSTSYGPLIVRPRDKKDNYVKRCVAVAGDVLQVINGQVFVNGVAEKAHAGMQSSYIVKTKGDQINSRILDELNVNPADVYFDSTLPGYADLPLTKEDAAVVSKLPIVVSVQEHIDNYPPDYPDSPIMLFPFTETVKWTRDNYGPIWIPRKGASVYLNKNTLPFYYRLITSYEGNKLEVKGNQILVNGTVATTYTFKQNYYWMMGDNRHNSLDSRYWGFVPEDHIVGTPSLVWWSKDNSKHFPSNIRWSRLLKGVRHI